MPVWSLHPQLENDTTPVGDLALCRVLAINDADYPWLILVPRRAGATEIADLGGDAAVLMEEILLASRAQGRHALRQAQHRRDRQRGAAAARPHRRPLDQRPAVAEAGVGECDAQRGKDGRSVCGTVDAVRERFRTGRCPADDRSGAGELQRERNHRAEPTQKNAKRIEGAIGIAPLVPHLREDGLPSTSLSRIGNFRLRVSCASGANGVEAFFASRIETYPSLSGYPLTALEDLRTRRVISLTSGKILLEFSELKQPWI